MNTRAERGFDRPLEEILEGTIDWWRDAGVDCLFTDEPARWTKPPEPGREAGAGQRPAGDRSERARERVPDRTAGQAPAPNLAHTSTPAPRREPDRSAWPGALSDFAQWWLARPELDHGRVADRVAPRGPGRPRLMVVVPEPEPQDGDRLLSGPQGKLLNAMLAAMETSEDQVYFASVLTRHTPAADWEAMSTGEDESDIGAVLRHHVGLVMPERILAFGSNILPLFQNGPPQQPANLRQFNHEGQSIPLLPARSLGALTERPRWKQQFWQAWLEWTR